ncbi:MAG: hypothetical protein B7Z66_14530 [Chromatiales bacterium 21-64-14]|nr:MAG: hypothetical protein B7Z66_14530 [Chromatiales bacterium 21-64-14]
MHAFISIDFASLQNVNVIVRDQTGGEIHFKLKMHTKFGKVFASYCAKKGVDVNSMKFLFDGDRINEEKTPMDLEMTDGDVVDAVVEQIGGGDLGW